jgi:parallel beta-helix repeat protein
VLDPTGATEENVEDWVGGMTTGNTETGISVDYQDADGTLDFAVDTHIPYGAVVLEVGDDLGTLVAAESAGTTFFIRAGIHREQTIVPKEGDTYICEDGAVLSGAKIITPGDCSLSGSDYVCSGQTQQLSQETQASACVADVSNDSYTECHTPEELFWNGKRVYKEGSEDGAEGNIQDGATTVTAIESGLDFDADGDPDTITRTSGSWITDGFENGEVITVKNSWDNDGQYTVHASTGPTATVLTLVATDTLTDEVNDEIAEVRADHRWVFDYANDEIVFRKDPNDATLIETSTTQKAFNQSAGTSYDVRGCVIEKYANNDTTNVIQCEDATCNFEDLEVRWNHGDGLNVGGNGSTAGPTVIRNVHAHNNGKGGITISMPGADDGGNIYVIDSEIGPGNDDLAVNYSNGGKWFGPAQSHALIHLVNSYIHDNYKRGVWFDTGAEAVVANNVFENNHWYGLEFEFACGATVSNNTFIDNGYAGFFISSSERISLHHNTFDGNGILRDSPSPNYWQILVLENGSVSAEACTGGTANLEDIEVVGNTFTPRTTSPRALHVKDQLTEFTIRDNHYNLREAGSSPFRIDSTNKTLIQWQTDGGYDTDQHYAGDDPASTCTVGEIFIDLNTAVDTNCTTTSNNSLCLCTATDTWTELDNN